MDKTDVKNGPIYTAMPGGRRRGRGVIGDGGTPTPTGFVTFVAFVFFYMSTTHTHAGRRAIKKF